MNEKRKIYRLTSLRSRYRLSIIIFVIVVCLLNVTQFFLMDNFFTYKTKRDMIAASNEINQLDVNSSSFFQDISGYEAAYNIFVEIYQPKDSLIYSTNNNDWIYQSDDYSGSDNSSGLKPRIMKIISHKELSETAYFEIRQEFYASAKYIVYGNSQDDQTIEIYYSVDVIESNSKTASIVIFAVSILLSLMLITLTLIYLYTFVFPLEKINNITKRIAKMDFDETCPPFKIRELNELSESVNALTASLELTLRDLKSKNARLEKEIEKEHSLEETRKQFIANASHELKTPISIIQGYAEGIKCSVDESSDEYCDVIIEESEKMNNLVLKLLELTHYDFVGYSPNFAAFSIKEFLDYLISSRMRKITEQGITFEMNIDSSFIGYGDKDMLSDVFGNYISNAISHCSGEKIIRVVCKEHDSVYTVSVFNTGKNISSNDLEHIWESFYRADKAHSRAQGRFGLGLSIAASVQNRHHQKYGIDNLENGVEFWFDIAKYNP